MKVFFRVDASATIGTGHVMRCLTLANELRTRGNACCFIARHLPDFLKESIESQEHAVCMLHSVALDNSNGDLAHAHFLGTSQALDAAQCGAQLLEGEVDWLVVDHYALDSRWETLLREKSKRILVIDDLADRVHECDLLVDQNVYADMASRYQGLIPKTAVALYGLRYALLRTEFRLARKLAKVRVGPAKRLFIFLGGMDSANYTLPILRAVSNLNSGSLAVDVVVGKQHPALQEIQAICQTQQYICHVQTKTMAELILQADAAIGAGGSSSWERACLGLPTLAFIVAPNQAAPTLHADKLELLQAAQSDIHDSASLKFEIDSFLKADIQREHISRNCLKSINPNGAQRIANQMDCFDLVLRTVNIHDSKTIFNWRNHPAIRLHSTHSEPITWETHQAWLNRVITDPDRLLYIATIRDEPVGVIRFDLDGDIAEVSLYLDPDQLGRGLGTALLIQGEEKIRNERRGIKEFIATVLANNYASHHLFNRCEYSWCDTKYVKTL